MPYSHLYPIVFQLSGNAADIRLAVMIGEQHLWFDDACGMNKLVHRHGVRLVARQEGNVNVFEFSHFGDVLGISGDIDS